jgi:hypothetical protein
VRQWWYKPCGQKQGGHTYCQSKSPHRFISSLFFGYGGVIFAFATSAENELLNFPFRGKLQTKNRFPSDVYIRREAVLTTGIATVRCGMSGHAGAKDGQIVLNADSSVLDSGGNGQKKFSQFVHTQEVTGSSPVVSTKKFLIS